MPLQFSSQATVSAPGLREATQAEAQAGTILGRFMSPLRVSQSLAAKLVAGQGVTLTYGTTINVKITDQNSQSYTFDSFPPTNDCAIRIAAGTDGHSIGVSYTGAGNGLWLLDTFTGKYRMGRINGAFQTIDLHNCTIDGVAGQSLANSTIYNVYAYFAAAADNFVSLEFSTAATTQGFEGPIVKGWLFKTQGVQTFKYRYIGSVKSDSAGKFWRENTADGLTYTGVYMSGIASRFDRQNLNYHTKISGGNNSVTWAEINANQYLAAFLFGDGDEPFVCLAGTVQNDGTGNTVSVGICIDGATTPEDFVDVYCAVANKTYPFCVIARGGDFSNDLHYYRVFMKNSAGTGAISGNRLASPSTGATFAMKIEQ